MFDLRVEQTIVTLNFIDYSHGAQIYLKLCRVLYYFSKFLKNHELKVFLS